MNRELELTSAAGTRHQAWLWNEDSDTAVLAVHGFTGRGSDFGLCAEVLPDLTWMAVDVVGRDLEGGPAVLPINALAAMLHGAARTLQARRRLLLGYSMGGRIALATLLGAPELFAGIILAGATAGIDDSEARARRRASDASLAARARRDGAAAFVADWQAHPLVRTQERIRAPWRTRILESRNSHTPEGLAQCLEQYGQGTLPSLWDALAPPPVPLLALAGEADTRYHVPLHRFASLPHSTTHIIPGAGHAAHLEAPEAFGEIVRQWLDALRHG